MLSRRKASVYAGLVFLSFFLSTREVKAVENLEKIDYDFLAESVWTDHVRAFRKLFEIQPIDSFLEFGLGLGTKFYLENCKNVTSIELVIRSRYQNIVPWYFDCIELFKNYRNWSPYLQPLTKIVNDANDLAEQGIDPETVNKEYIAEINRFLDRVFAGKQYQVAFVDPGIHLRGDLVNALFGRAEIIAAHDTNYLSQCYGWSKIKTPESYEKIIFSHGSGTTFWIAKTRQDLIQRLSPRTIGYYLSVSESAQVN